MSQLAAVLTGDLIASTTAGPEAVNATMGLLEFCANEIGDDTRFTRFRGDGWQMLISTPGQCLWASLYILARLRADPAALDSRVSVGIGDVLSLGSAGLASAYGSAFEAAGEGLDRMPRDRSLTISGTGVGVFQDVTFAFAEDQARRWSREQAEAMAYALHPNAPTRAEIATRLGITRQAVGLRLKVAGHHLLEMAQQAFFGHFSGTGPAHG